MPKKYPTCVVNPATGRAVKFGSSTYRRVLGIKKGKRLKGKPVTSRPQLNGKRSILNRFRSGRGVSRALEGAFLDTVGSGGGGGFLPNIGTLSGIGPTVKAEGGRPPLLIDLSEPRNRKRGRDESGHFVQKRRAVHRPIKGRGKETILGGFSGGRGTKRGRPSEGQSASKRARSTRTISGKGKRRSAGGGGGFVFVTTRGSKRGQLRAASGGPARKKARSVKKIRGKGRTAASGGGGAYVFATGRGSKHQRFELRAAGRPKGKRSRS